MKRKFLTDLGFLILVNLLVKPFWILGIDRTVQNVVGPEEYGFYFALFNFSFLFHIILDFGINGFNNRAIAREPEKLKNFWGSMIFLKMLLAGIYLIITFGAAIIVGYGNIHFEFLILLAINQILSSYVLYLRSNIAALHYFKWDAVMSILDRLIMILICGLLLWGNLTDRPFQLIWLIYSQTAAYSIALVIGLILVWRKGKLMKFSWDRKLFGKIIKQSYPFALLGLLMSIYYRIDGVMIDRMLPVNGADQAGVYASAFRLLDAAIMIAYLFSTILMPMFSRMLKKGEPVKELLSISWRGIGMIAGLVVIPSFIFKEEIMFWLYTEATTDWAELYGWLMFSFMVIGLSYIFSTLLTAAGKMKTLNWIALGGTFINICLNYILIPEYEAFGAAIATLATQSVLLIFYVYHAYKLVGFGKISPHFFSFIAFLGISTAINWGLSSYIELDWRILLVIGLGLSTIVALGVRLFNLRALLSLINGRE